MEGLGEEGDREGGGREGWKGREGNTDRQTEQTVINTHKTVLRLQG